MYRALYRKWRPQRFADVVGQTAIVTALQNQIAAGRIGHAYLFTGTRGTGKTTCAKIFAKAVNCLDTTSPDPCGKCEICKGIDSGSIMDIIEMDAASNNGVDDIRDLRDEVAYLPSVCKYKVYIIDEVHMLSTAAFNALLKTMEEPPEHVIFILATTEVQKVPVTILSRCQRYDFTRITADDIAKRLLYVAGEEKIDLDENAAQLIGRLADGAMRDALSILDTCAGVDNKVDEALVRRMAGVTDRGYLFEISDAINAHDSVTALEKIAELRQQSVDMRRLCMELAGHYRNLMLCALPGGTSLLTGISPEEESAYTQRKDFPQAEAIRAINAFGSALEKMSRGTDQRIELELAVFSLTQPEAAVEGEVSLLGVNAVVFAVVDLDGQLIVLAQYGGDIRTEGGVTAVVAGDLHAVQRNSCAGIDTLELQPDLLGSNIKGGCRELRFIGAGTAPIIIAAVLTIDVVAGVRQIDGDGLAVRAGELPVLHQLGRASHCALLCCFLSYLYCSELLNSSQ